MARGGAPAGARARAGGSEAEGHTSSEASDEATSLVARWGTCLCGRQAQRGPAGAGARARRRERRRVRNKRAANRSRERQEAMDAVDFEEVAALRGVLRELTAEVATLRAQAEEDRQRGDGPVASESISEQMRAVAADARVKSAEGRLLEASAKLEWNWAGVSFGYVHTIASNGLENCQLLMYTPIEEELVQVRLEGRL